MRQHMLHLVRQVDGRTEFGDVIAVQKADIAGDVGNVDADLEGGLGEGGYG